MLLRSLLLVSLAAALVAGCGGGVREQQQPWRGPVILISIDTLRSDHLPMYGYEGVETPHLDAFRADAVMFRHAYAPTPMTLPSHVTMLTGLLPTQHGIRDNVAFRFDGARHRSLPSILRQAGYASGASVSSYVLRSATGLGSLFDSYDDALNAYPGAPFREFQRSGEISVRSAQRWIETNGAKPFFFFLHLYEPHVPYEPPEPFRSRYPNAYDGEIAAADAMVGGFLDFLRRRGLYDEALIVVTSDHGEGLNDHGEDQHSILIYRESMQVPLLVKFPGGARRGQTVDVPAQLADIFPTVLEQAGLEAGAVAGRSLATLSEARNLYMESYYPRYHFGWSELRGIVNERWHLIEAPATELYDLVRDPGERSDRAGDQRREVARLRQALDQYRDAVPDLPAVDAEEAAKLAALGYIGTPRDPGQNANRPNPNRMVHTLAPLREGIDRAARGDLDGARAILAGIVEKAPENNEARLQLAEVLARIGRLDEAAGAYRAAMARSEVFSPELALGLADVLVQQQRFDEARQLASLSETANPRRARSLLARVALEQGDLAGALRHAQSVASDRDRQPSDLLLLAEVRQRQGDLAGALTILDDAARQAAELELRTPYRLEFLRADTLARLDRIPEAVAAYEKEIAAYPRNLRAYANLAVLYFLTGERSKSEGALRRLVETNPHAAARQLAARTRQTLR